MTCEDAGGDGCVKQEDEFRDLELAHNWARPGKKPESADLVSIDSDASSVSFDDVTIRPGKTVAFMQVVTLAPNIGSARKDKVSKGPKEIFKGLTKAERRALVNW
jgi:hypothetical protein